MAHQQAAYTLEEDVQKPLEQFAAERREQYDTIVAQGKIQQEKLKGFVSAKEKAQNRYYKACTEYEQAELSKSKKLDEKRIAKAETCEAYSYALKELNTVEKSVYGELHAILTQLHDMETARVDLMQKAMVGFVRVRLLVILCICPCAQFAGSSVAADGLCPSDRGRAAGTDRRARGVGGIANDRGGRFDSEHGRVDGSKGAVSPIHPAGSALANRVRAFGTLP